METSSKVIWIFLLTQAFSIWVYVLGVQNASSAQTYPMCFMNITGGGDFIDAGFIQILGCSINVTGIRVEALTSDVDEFGTVGLEMGTTFNYTKDFDSVTFVSSIETSGIERTGIIPSSSENAFFIGVKSDVGSTDAFLSLPLITTSMEFIVAGWMYQPPFATSCAIVPALNHTCVEIYKIFPDGSAIMLGSSSLNEFDTFRYFGTFSLNSDGSRDPNFYEDLTGYYINTTKPVQVLCGHECAQVPTNMPFCDHMFEQIPPINQLGMIHVVPPIDGRSPNAGYIVRVVAANDYTGVTWQSPSISGSQVIRLGQFAEIVTYKTMEALLIQCNVTCLVMQYNKGRRAASNDVPSDPFMMLTVPVDHFTENAGFATPNYCDSYKLRIKFDNWVSIVTSASNKDNIRFGGKVLSNVTSNQWDTTNIPGYAIITVDIDHGYYYVSVDPPGSATFACYVYGHSILTTSSSAYGFSANYKMVGESVSSVWMDSIGGYNQYLDSIRNETCATEQYFSGQLVLNDTYVPFPFTLSANFDPVSMSSVCFQYYNQSLWTQLTNLTRLINYWICTTEMCSYLNGQGVAVNYYTLTAKFLQDLQGHYNGLTVTVEVDASLDTYSADFAACRVEIRNFMQYFVNWPAGSSSLFPPQGAPPGCPQSLHFSTNTFQITNEACAA